MPHAFNRDYKRDKGKGRELQQPQQQHRAASKQPPVAATARCPPELRGSTALALHHLGVFPCERSATEALDAQIEPAHATLAQNGKRKRGIPTPESEAGIRGEWWSVKAMSLALHNAGWHFKKVYTQHAVNPRKPTKTRMVEDLRECLKQGDYLIMGLRNPTDLPNWAYTVAVSSGVVRRKHKTESIDALCLDYNNRPDPRLQTFMCDITQVYRLHRCTNPELQKRGECKGECVGGDGGVNPELSSYGQLVELTEQEMMWLPTARNPNGNGRQSRRADLTGFDQTVASVLSTVLSENCDGLGISDDED